MKITFGLILLGAIIVTAMTGSRSVELKPTQSKEIVEKLEPVVKYDTIHLNRATRYHATVAQCDDSPFKTADGSVINPAKVKSGEQRWVALSRDLILDKHRDEIFSNENHWKGFFKFGDTILVQSETHPFINGKWVVHDCMSGRAVKSVDFLAIPGMTPKLGVGKDVKIIIRK